MKLDAYIAKAITDTVKSCPQQTKISFDLYVMPYRLVIDGKEIFEIHVVEDPDLKIHNIKFAVEI